MTEIISKQTWNDNLHFQLVSFTKWNASNLKQNNYTSEKYFEEAANIG